MKNSPVISADFLSDLCLKQTFQLVTITICSIINYTIVCTTSRYYKKSLLIPGSFEGINKCAYMIC